MPGGPGEIVVKTRNASVLRKSVTIVNVSNHHGEDID